MAAAASFHHFSNQLYCSGSEERLCVLPHEATRHRPGECLWYTPANKQVLTEDMADKGMATRHHWDPVAAGAVSASQFQRFSTRQAISACLRGKHILMTGESTTRDLFWELSAAAGLQTDRKYCMNFPDKKTEVGRAGLMEKPCTRVSDDPATNTRITFQFVSRANETREVAVTRSLLAGRPADAVFPYCFGYDWYNTVMPPLHPGDTKHTGPSDTMGNACMQHLDSVFGDTKPPIYLFGPTFPPAWVSPYENRTRPDSVMANIFASINHAAGISCVRHGATNEYRVVSTRGIRGPIDRYNVVGHRKKDAIRKPCAPRGLNAEHVAILCASPVTASCCAACMLLTDGFLLTLLDLSADPTPNAHVPVIQLMLNHLCPGPNQKSLSE